MEITKGQIVYSGQSSGRVMQKVGAHAVKVWTSFERPEQDFMTHKVTVIKGFRAEVWPLRWVQTEPPKELTV
jgi:hypothetical protein